MLSFKIKSALRFLAISFFVLQQGKLNAQCGTCTTTITSNSPSSYTVSAGQTVCVATGFDFTGTITLSGGTLCNSGTVHNINFNSGTFDNYGLYSKLTGTIAVNNTAPLTINNYNEIELKNLDFGNGSNVIINTYSKMLVNGWVDIHRDSEEDLITMNVYNSLDEKSTANLNVTKDFTLTKGRLMMNVSNNSKVCAKVECTGFVNIGGQFTVNNSPFVLVVNPNGIFNVKKAVSLDGKKDKEISNRGTINFTGDFNVGGNGQNTGLVTINNLNRSTFNINGNVNFNYNNGTVNFINDKGGYLFIGKSFNITKQNNSFTNYSKMIITRDLILDNGLFTNNSEINIRSIEIKNGTLTNNGGLNVTRDLLTTNNSGIINNNSSINVGRNFINTSTVNLGKKSVITTLNYENEGNSVINGPANINGDNGDPDSTNYASVIISGNSKNSGYINNYVLVYDKTRPANSTVGFDDFGNANRVGQNAIIVTRALACRFIGTIGFFASASPSVVCSGAQVNLFTFTSIPFYLDEIPVTYSWNTNPVTNSPSAVVFPTNTGLTPSVVTYTVTATFTFLNGTCTRTRVVSFTVNPLPTANAGVDQSLSSTAPIIIGGNPSATGGVPPYNNYVWSPSLFLNSNSLPNPTSTPTATVNYTLTVSDANNCSGSDQVKIIFNDVSYAKLLRELDGSFYLAKNNKIGFAFQNEYVKNDKGLKFKIYDKTHTVVADNISMNPTTYPFEYKDNYVILDLAQLNPAIINGYFILEVFDKMDERFYLRFKN